MMNGQLLGGGGAGIKFLRAGTITIANGSLSNTDTFAAVVTANSILFHLGSTHAGSDAGVSDALCTLELTNTTTITATRQASVNPVVVSYVLVEFYPGFIKSLQRGTISVGGAASATAIITSVDTTKSFIVPGGWLCNQTRDDLSVSSLVLTNATTVTAAFGTNPTTGIVAYQVVELYT